jgi:hypothetical protein
VRWFENPSDFMHGVRVTSIVVSQELLLLLLLPIFPFPFSSLHSLPGLALGYRNPASRHHDMGPGRGARRAREHELLLACGKKGLLSFR